MEAVSEFMMIVVLGKQKKKKRITHDHIHPWSTQNHALLWVARDMSKKIQVVATVKFQ